MKQFILLLGFGPLLMATNAMARQTELARDTGEFLLPPAKNYSYENAAYYGYSRQVQNDMRTGMFKVLEAIHQTPILNPPRGWAIGSSAALTGSGPDGRRRLIGSSGIIFKGYYRDLTTRKVTRDVEGPSLNLYFNNIDVIIHQNELEEGAYFEEPLIARYVQGFPVYNKFVVITRNKAPLFVPASREHVLLSEIAIAKSRVEEEKKLIAEGSPYQQWLKTKREVVEGAMQGYELLAQSEPAKAKAEKEKFLKGMQQQDSAMKADEAKYLEERGAGLKKWQEELKGLQDKLAGMSLQEKQTQAVGVVSKMPLVRINRAFFNPKLPMSAIQLVVIDLYKYVPGMVIYEQLLDKEKKALFKYLQDNLDLIKIQAALP